jgi:hypothetical protein
MNLTRVHRRRLFASLILIGIAQRLMPWARAQDTQWLRLDGLPQPSGGVEVEGSHETQKVSGGRSTYDQISVIPFVGLDTRGSIYHPNLCTFNLSGELGWGWEHTSTESSGYTQRQNNSSDLRRYLAQVYLLQEKQYNANFFATQDHTFQNYSSFNTLTVDSTRYGGGINWYTDAFTLTADAGYWDQQNSSLTGYSEIAEKYFNVNAVNYRQSGQTTFTTRGALYENTLNNGATQNSDNYGVGLSDSETFGNRKQITLTSGVTYSQSQYSSQQLDMVTANENLTISHNPNLDSYGTVNYNHSDYQPTVTVDQVQGLYGVRHRLFESLTSTADVHGYYNNSDSGGGNSSTTDQYGLGGTESYNKRLGSWGRLTVGVGVVGDHVDNNSMGTVQTTIDEPHTITATGFFLNRPNVIASSVVVRGTGGVVATEGVDYNLNLIGDLTQITLIPTSAILSNGEAVLVTYESAAPGSASYETLNSSFQVRLDFFSKYGIYGRLNWMDDNAPPEALVQTLTDWVVGADYTLSWFRTGVEFEDYISNFSTYQAGRAFQNFTFRPASNSTLGISFNESVYDYSSGGSQTTYQMFSHYQVQFLSSLSWFAEAGAIYQDILGTGTWTGTARTGMTWTQGKISARASYDFNDQHTGSGQFEQEFLRHHFFFYLKRVF